MCNTGKSTSFVSVLQIAAFISERLKILETDLSIGRTHILLVLQPINHLLFSFLHLSLFLLPSLSLALPLPGPPYPYSSFPPSPWPSLSPPLTLFPCCPRMQNILCHRSGFDTIACLFWVYETMEACCHDDVMMAMKHNGRMHDVMVTM